MLKRCDRKLGCLLLYSEFAMNRLIQKKILTMGAEKNKKIFRIFSRLLDIFNLVCSLLYLLISNIKCQHLVGISGTDHTAVVKPIDSVTMLYSRETVSNNN